MTPNGVPPPWNYAAAVAAILVAMRWPIGWGIDAFRHGQPVQGVVWFVVAACLVQFALGLAVFNSPFGPFDGSA